MFMAPISWARRVAFADMPGIKGPDIPGIEEADIPGIDEARIPDIEARGIVVAAVRPRA
jgi:hypothetical protein